MSLNASLNLSQPKTNRKASVFMAAVEFAPHQKVNENLICINDDFSENVEYFVDKSINFQFFRDWLGN